MAKRTRRVRWPILLVLVLTLWWCISPLWAQVEEKATEEIMPGVRVRTSGTVIIQARPQPCDPPCSEPGRCEGVCRDSPCPAGSSKLARCMSCVWECRK